MFKPEFLTQPKAEPLTEAICLICSEVDSAIKNLLEKQTSSSCLQKAMAYATLKGGKRFRPLLIKAFADLFAIPFKNLIPIAVAVELLHAYSLVHDDLPAMDNSDMRRGQPSCWKQFDEATAILVGDALQTLAFEALASAPLKEHVCLELIMKFAQACGANGMVAGQMLDISQGHKNQLEEIETLQRLKTGELIAFCCEAGAIVAEADRLTKEKLKEAGYKLGLIYQMVDDFLDLKENPESIGKPVNQDQDKATLISLKGHDQSWQLIETYKREIKSMLKGFEETSFLVEEVLEWVVSRES